MESKTNSNTSNKCTKCRTTRSVFINTNLGFIRAILGDAREVEYTQDVRFAAPMDEDVAENMALILTERKLVKHYALLAAVHPASDNLMPFDVGDQIVDREGTILEIEFVNPCIHQFIARREDDPTTREVVGFEEALDHRHWRKVA